MIVPVALMKSVAVSIVDVVHMVTVRNSYVTALRAMLVIVVLMNMMLGGLALIPVALMFTVEVAVMDVINVITVRNSYVTALRAVGVGVLCMGCTGHGELLFPISGTRNYWRFSPAPLFSTRSIN
ncbi:Putative membrane protein [Corynebacterium pseudotuberculosis]|nr:Hypothetical protein Cp3995_0048 [Corynebacterium pseudotuberculosis 3/99-5]AFH50963.1 Hypothetical protein Cp267_0054 [Corynebacterium pseudotuberculosis 267]AIG06401.1 hypothetical protein CPTA_00572 [Corynebacterium pseudotuberculosis]AIG09016.1 hypothetical protein CPTB_00960 [Corynebacterium pseudotuberculosis]AIG10910.1 hypothetical protein CPTC_00622 [Corynebacterium pseudotuberculosis]